MIRQSTSGLAVELNEPMIEIQDPLSTRQDDQVTLPSKNELTTLMGVYIPCMLSILGAILFLRLSWAVGQAGLLGVIGIFVIAGGAVLLTALSISAISTNGTMGGGGAYYMISRSIGPEFGGAVGIIFYFANAFATTFYLVAFAESIVNTFFDEAGLWTKILIASIALALTLIAAYIGADFFSKLNAIILAFIVLAILTVALSLFFGGEFGCSQGSGPKAIAGFTGFNSTTFADNLTPNFGIIIDDATDKPSASGELNDFFRVFGIVFPAMTGIMAGANLSGDLRDPGRSIGRGTINAILSSLAIYIGLAFLAAWTLETNFLKENDQAFQKIACWPAGEYLVVLGIVSSTLSSGLGALTGAARVLQAFCKDFSSLSHSDSAFGQRIVTLFQFLSYGTPGKNEPRHAVILTWAIAQALLLLGSLDLLASIITNCFLMTYFFTNFACFVLKITGAPNFRPRFRFFSWHTALLGAILNIVIMFLASPIFATVSIILMAIVFAIIVYSAPEVPWGDVSQALIYHQVRKYLLRLDERKSHPKFWRPAILLIVEDPLQSQNLVDFCNNLKKGGLYVVGDVLVGDIQTTGSACVDLQAKWNEFIPLVNIKAFPEVVLGESFRAGCQTLMLCAGLGSMKPNTIVLPLVGRAGSLTRAIVRNENASKALRTLEDIERIHQNVNSKPAVGSLHDGRKDRCQDFVGLLRDALFLNKNLLVPTNFDQLDKDFIVNKVVYGEDPTNATRIKKKKRDPLFIDIWFTNELDPDDLHSYSGGLSIMMQLAHGLNRTDIWQECTKLRIVQLLQEPMDEPISDEDKHFRVKELHALLENVRVQASIEVLVMKAAANESDNVVAMNDFIREHTTKTAIIFLNLPLLPEEASPSKDKEYVQRLESLTTGLPPTVLTTAGQRQTVIATEI